MSLYKSKIEIHDNFPIKGVKYLDLNPLYKSNTFTDELVKECVNSVGSAPFHYIGVVESRGYIIGSMLAKELNKGLVLLRSKPKRLPGKTSKVKHTLEYGKAQMEVQNGYVKVLIFDDVLATGGTVGGAVECLKKGGYEPVGALFIAELQHLKPKLDIPYTSIIKYDGLEDTDGQE